MTIDELLAELRLSQWPERDRQLALVHEARQIFAAGRSKPPLRGRLARALARLAIWIDRRACESVLNLRLPSDAVGRERPT